MMETQESAALTSIITGRRNTREGYYRALQILKARGLVKHLPPIENVFTVGNREEFPIAASSDVSEVKITVMRRLLDALNQLPLASNKEPHFWNFSDDDPENFKQAREFLTKQKDDGKWPNVKVSVTYTSF
jgi:hypothetical protein